MKLRRMVHACGYSMVPGGGACSCLPLAVWWRVLAACDQAPVGLCLALQRSCHDPRTDGASLRLLNSDKRKRTRDVCSEGECLPPAIRHLQVVWLCNGAAMTLH